MALSHARVDELVNVALVRLIGACVCVQYVGVMGLGSLSWGNGGEGGGLDWIVSRRILKGKKA